MPIWSDFFKLFTYASEKDPLAKKKDTRNLQGAGIGQPDVYPTLGGEGQAGGAGGGQGSAQLRQSYDMIDTTTLTNRSMRYKEYERLRNVPEIEMTMTVLADEACVADDTKIATPFGFQTIEPTSRFPGGDRDPELFRKSPTQTQRSPSLALAPPLNAQKANRSATVGQASLSRKFLPVLLKPLPQEDEVCRILLTMGSRFHSIKKAGRRKRNRHTVDLPHHDIPGSFRVVNPSGRAHQIHRDLVGDTNNIVLFKFARL